MTVFKVLNEYNAEEDKFHSSADDIASDLVGHLEASETNFAAMAEIEQISKENEVERAMRDEDLQACTRRRLRCQRMSISWFSQEKTGPRTMRCSRRRSTVRS